MKRSLNNIQHFIQSYVNIVSIILKTDITVVDKNFVRIAGTNLYLDQVGKTINHANLYQRVMETGQPVVMTKSTYYNSCFRCALFHNCTELADIAYPIFYDNEVIGVISMIAFDKKTQNDLVVNSANYLDFLKHMSVLIESKLFKSDQVNLIDHKPIKLIKNLETTKHSNKTQFITSDSRITEMLNIIQLTANSDSTILITGESGTGKEVLAKVIHQISERNNQPMISLNCAAIPENLIESELFGYEKGAFTGANRDGQAGKFELANGGILFLDEIGEMPIAAQTRLLCILVAKQINLLM